MQAWVIPVKSQYIQDDSAFIPDSIQASMYRVNDHFLAQKWKRADRNWIRGTYFTGLMAFYQISEDENLLKQAMRWGAKHGWRTGTEWIYPANRMTCVQTYLELYFIQPNDHMIDNSKQVMDKRITNTKEASKQGWDYVDALYVGTPAYIMMSAATGNPGYASYGHRIFKEVCQDLYDEEYHLFYRDNKAKSQQTSTGGKVFWSRGNGWAIASIPRILDYIDEDDPQVDFYTELLQNMAGTLEKYQGENGFWTVNLVDNTDYPAPESSGTAFFTYAIAWGINNGYLDNEQYLPVVNKSWKALYYNVNQNGKVQWGQDVAREPENVSREDSHEYVSGAYLLAASEVYKLSILLAHKTE